jgi:hypothetical protein
MLPVICYHVSCDPVNLILTWDADFHSLQTVTRANRQSDHQHGDKSDQMMRLADRRLSPGDSGISVIESLFQ